MTTATTSAPKTKSRQRFIPWGDRYDQGECIAAARELLRDDRKQEAMDCLTFVLGRYGPVNTGHIEPRSTPTTGR